jgi:hypothetical protein
MFGKGLATGNKKTLNYLIIKGLVRIIGLEPTRLAAPDPKSGMSTNFTISAKIVSANIIITSVIQRKN